MKCTEYQTLEANTKRKGKERKKYSKFSFLFSFFSLGFSKIKSIAKKYKKEIKIFNPISVNLCFQLKRLSSVFN